MMILPASLCLNLVLINWNSELGTRDSVDHVQNGQLKLRHVVSTKMGPHNGRPSSQWPDWCKSRETDCSYQFVYKGFHKTSQTDSHSSDLTEHGHIVLIVDAILVNWIRGLCQKFWWCLEVGAHWRFFLNVNPQTRLLCETTTTRTTANLSTLWAGKECLF